MTSSCSLLRDQENTTNRYRHTEPKASRKSVGRSAAIGAQDATDRYSTQILQKHMSSIGLVIRRHFVSQTSKKSTYAVAKTTDYIPNSGLIYCHLKSTP